MLIVHVHTETAETYGPHILVEPDWDAVGREAHRKYAHEGITRLELVREMAVTAPKSPVAASEDTGEGLGSGSAQEGDSGAEFRAGDEVVLPGARATADLTTMAYGERAIVRAVPMRRLRHANGTHTPACAREGC